MNSRLTKLQDWASRAMQAHYNAKILARCCDISLRQLERFFKVEFGEPPQEWLNHARLQEAQRLLTDGKSVKETAFELGFRQVSHFCREFKNFTGSTPKRFGVSKCTRN